MRAEPHVFHLHSGAGLYGAEHMLLSLIPALAEQHVESTLLCLDNYRLGSQPLYERARASGIPAQRLPCRGRFDWNTVRALRTILRCHPEALLHVHGYKSAFYAWLACWAGGPPIISTLHGHIDGTRRLNLYQALERRLMRGFARICVVSGTMPPVLASGGVPADRIELIENGVDTSRFRPDVEPMPRSAQGIPEDAFVFGSVLRLSAEKNPLGLLDAFASVLKQFPRCWLVMAGDGPLHGDVLAHACALGIEGHVRLLGARDDLEHFYPMLDCFVLPSLSEGLPLALLEAMAAARPLVGTAVGQVPGVLGGLDAALVPAGDNDALAAAMRSAITENQGTRPDLRQRVVERYSAARMARDYATIYRNLCNGNDYAMA
jgi:glycosyltransferase involved in cell wall biosynthesis